jgi:membrane protease YdiL (CAAX protease family)
VSDAPANPEPAVPQETGPARRTTPGERWGAIAEVVLCSGYPTQLFLIALMAVIGVELKTPDGRLSAMFISTLSLLDTALVLGLIVLFLTSHGERPRDVLFGHRPPVREAFLGLGLLVPTLIAASLILFVLSRLVPQLHNVPRNPVEDMLTSKLNAALFGVVAVIAGGVREEIQRGFILHRFERYLGGGIVGVVVYSVAFGLGHEYQGWDAVVTVSSLGAIWGTIYLIRRSVIAPMVSHAGFNLAQVLRFIAPQ